jgi:hypothetical protein
MKNLDGLETLKDLNPQKRKVIRSPASRKQETPVRRSPKSVQLNQTNPISSYFSVPKRERIEAGDDRESGKELKRLKMSAEVDGVLVIESDNDDDDDDDVPLGAAPSETGSASSPSPIAVLSEAIPSAALLSEAIPSPLPIAQESKPSLPRLDQSTNPNDGEANCIHSLRRFRTNAVVNPWSKMAENWTPFALQNFSLIIKTVYASNNHLFYDSEKAYYENFFLMPQDSQVLFVKLFYRKVHAQLFDGFCL